MVITKQQPLAATEWDATKSQESEGEEMTCMMLGPQHQHQYQNWSGRRDSHHPNSLPSVLCILADKREAVTTLYFMALRTSGYSPQVPLHLSLLWGFQAYTLFCSLFFRVHAAPNQSPMAKQELDVVRRGHSPIQHLRICFHWARIAAQVTSRGLAMAKQRAAQRNSPGNTMVRWIPPKRVYWPGVCVMTSPVSRAATGWRWLLHGVVLVFIYMDCCILLFVRTTQFAILEKHH